MKRLIPCVTALVLVPVASTAATLSEADLAACEAEVKAHYGEHAEVKLVNSRPVMGGSRILVAADVGPNDKAITRTYLATCWAPAADTFVADSGEPDSDIGRGGEIAIVE